MSLKDKLRKQLVETNKDTDFIESVMTVIIQFINTSNNDYSNFISFDFIGFKEKPKTKPKTKHDNLIFYAETNKEQLYFSLHIGSSSNLFNGKIIYSSYYKCQPISNIDDIGRSFYLDFKNSSNIKIMTCKDIIEKYSISHKITSF